MQTTIRLRALEKDDLRFVHQINNNRRVMSYWFEEPYESFVELEELYLKHIHDQSERRFIAVNQRDERIGLVELVEISYIHRRAEFQIVIAPEFQGQGFGERVTRMAIEYGFCVLNLNKLYLQVSTENPAAIKIYRRCGFREEGHLIDEYFIDGHYQDALRMYLLQAEFLSARASGGGASAA